MDELLKILQAFKEEQAKYDKLVDKFRRKTLENPLNVELKTQLAEYEKKLKEVQVFSETLERTERVLAKIDNVDIVDVKAAYNDAMGAKGRFMNAMSILITKNSMVNDKAFEIVEIIIGELDLSTHVKSEKGIKGYVFEKLIEAGYDIYKTFLPVLDKFDDVLFAIMPEVKTIPKAELEAKIVLDFKNSFLSSTAKEWDSLKPVNTQLTTVINEIIDDESLSDKDKYFKLQYLNDYLTNANDNLVPDENYFSNKVDKMLYVTLQELFEKCNTTVVQVCEYTESALDNNAVDSSKIIITKFTNNDDINKNIFDILSNMDVEIVDEVIQSHILKRVFPNTNIVYKGDGQAETALEKYEQPYADPELTEQTTSIGGQYANDRAKMREREALLRQQAKELPGLQKRAEKFGIDTELPYPQLKREVEAAEAAAAAERERKFREEQARIAKETRENQERIKENLAKNQPYTQNEGMQFEFGKLYDIGATFGIREQDEKGNLKVEYNHIKKLAGGIQKLKPEMVVYYAYLDNSVTGKYNEISVQTGLSQFHDSLQSATGLFIKKTISSIELYDSEQEKKNKQIGRFLEFKK